MFHLPNQHLDNNMGIDHSGKQISHYPNNDNYSRNHRSHKYTVRTLKSSILLYPEASYSFDGTSPTPLPESLGKCIKLLKVPVVMIRTYGAFQRDPLYNLLKLRNVDVSADMEYLLSPEEIASLTSDDINSLVSSRFAFDHFQWQKENGIEVKESFRTEGLSSV